MALRVTEGGGEVGPLQALVWYLSLLGAAASLLDVWNALVCPHAILEAFRGAITGLCWALCMDDRAAVWRPLARGRSRGGGDTLSFAEQPWPGIVALVSSSQFHPDS